MTDDFDSRTYQERIATRICHEWEQRADNDATYPLWATLAQSSSEDNRLFEAWLLRRTRETNPGYFTHATRG